jgi:hypothetical protein
MNRASGTNNRISFAHLSVHRLDRIAIGHIGVDVAAVPAHLNQLVPASQFIAHSAADSTSGSNNDDSHFCTS